jgi:MYXO-CTERM domain-containing protein
MRRTAPLFVSALACALYSAHASAHVCMVDPVSRVGPNCTGASPQKDGPCGVAERGSNVTVYRPGETITVKLNETIGHPSHYRIAFNPNGDDFEDPTSREDNTGAHPFVLKDNITDEDGDDGYPDNPANTQSVQVTLPNMLCENCTLQLIQVMYDKGGNGFGGDDGPGGKEDNDDMYYACADIALRGDPVAPGADAGAGDAAVPADASIPASDAGGQGGSDSGAPSGTAGGTTGGGGTTGSGSTPGAGGTAGGSEEEGEEEGGCACSTRTSSRQAGLLGTSLFALVLLRRRRRIRG